VFAATPTSTPPQSVKPQIIMPKNKRGSSSSSSSSSNSTKKKSNNNNNNNNSLCFQDALQEWKKNSDHDDVANVFFELANAPLVSYRLPRKEGEDDDDNNNNNNNNNDTNMITIQQDLAGACGNHTGGIVWETAYLLLEYLRATHHNCGTFLEVGAGCGLVGLGVYEMAIATKTVYLTETSDVMPNLLVNVEQHRKNHNRNRNNNHHHNIISNGDETKTKNLKQPQGAAKPTITKRKKPCSPLLLRTQTLDWTRFEQDCQEAKIRPHSIDTIVGTDVVFSMELVEPLLRTIRHLAHSETTILLCLQERCKDSHQLLLEAAPKHQLLVQDISDQVFVSDDGDDSDDDSDSPVPECSWGRDLECKLLKLSVVVTTLSSTTSVSSTKQQQEEKKKRKRDKKQDG
jgi:hypothetical protein